MLDCYRYREDYPIPSTSTNFARLQTAAVEIGQLASSAVLILALSPIEASVDTARI